MKHPLIITPPVTVLTIIKINMIVFFMWFFVPRFMMENFLVSWSSVEQGKIWTLITSVFSHNIFFHLFINMYAFYGFGAVMENVLGLKRFIRFYLTAGVLSSLAHCFVSYALLDQPGLLALGASGAVSGVIMLFCLLFPKEKILLLGFIPLPAISVVILVVGLDTWGLVAQTQGGSLPIGHGAHLGGALYAIIYYCFF